MSQTMPRMDMATAMLVALEDRVSAACITILDDAGFRVIRVKHIMPACERLPVVMPQLVVVPTNLRPEDEDLITDRCVAIGAEVLRLAPDVATHVLQALLVTAANACATKLR